jgi:uncharacterized hydrophobic protein (TIGR00271 family)
MEIICVTLFARLLPENLLTPEQLPSFEDKLFFEGARRRPYLERFGVLLFLSVIIATAGVIGDSTATVIGAMIVAPLMTPIMATAAALVMGRMDRAATSLLLVLIGIGTVVALSWLSGVLYPGVISFESNSQILARISPRVIDLVAALASGAAGAFCMSREDVADSLPGVAIAISLVPPLCVVGISLSAGEWGAARGALLLFITNMLAILLAGGGVLAALGLSRTAVMELRGGARRWSFIAIAVAVVLVTVPLAATGRALNNDAREEQQVRQVTKGWLTGTDFDVRNAQVNGEHVVVVIGGVGTPPPVATLVDAITKAVGHPVEVELDAVPSQKQRTSATPVRGAG